MTGRAEPMTRLRQAAKPGTRRPGGRTERNRRTVAQAALDLLRQGETRLSPAVVAEKAGVNVSTIYRRWPTRNHLLREALTLHTRSLRIPDTGDFASDVHALARALARFFSDPTEIALSAAMAANEDPDFTRYQSRWWAEGISRELAAIFERAAGRDELAPGADVEILIELLVSPMVVRTVVMRERLTPSYTKRLAETVIAASVRPPA